jgi:BolA-like protein 1
VNVIKNALMKKEQIEAKLKDRFTDVKCQVIDLTGTEDHWEVHANTKEFEGKSRIQQHKMVMDVFSHELKSGEIHAFSLKTST